MKSSLFVPVTFDRLGGFNFEDSRDQIADNEAFELTNFEIVGSSLVRRRGIARKSTTAAFGGSNVKIVGHNYVPGFRSEILINANEILTAGGTSINGLSKFYKSADGGVTWTAITTVGDVFCPKGILEGGIIYCPSNVGIHYYASGAAMSTIAGSPNGYLIGIVQDRFFVWNPIGHFILFSDAGDYFTWPSSNFIQILRTHGEYITSIMIYKDRLVIFKTESIDILYLTGTPQNWQLRQFVSGVGASGFYSTVVVDDWIYFAGHRGIYRTNLTTLEELSTSFRSIFNTRVSMGAFNDLSDPFSMQDAVGAFRNRVMFSLNFGDTIPSTASTHRWFVFYTDSEKWVEWIPANAAFGSDIYVAPTNFLNIENTHGSDSVENSFPQGLYWGDSQYAGRFYYWSPDHNILQDDGSAFESRFKSKRFYFDFPTDLKKIPSGQANLRCGEDIRLTLTHTVDDVAQPSQVYDTFAGGFLGRAQNLKFKGPGYVQRVSTDFVFSVPSGPGSIESTRVELYNFSYNIRYPRPIVTKEKQ